MEVNLFHCNAYRYIYIFHEITVNVKLLLHLFGTLCTTERIHNLTSILFMYYYILTAESNHQSAFRSTYLVDLFRGMQMCGRGFLFAS